MNLIRFICHVTTVCEGASLLMSPGIGFFDIKEDAPAVYSRPLHLDNQTSVELTDTAKVQHPQESFFAIVAHPHKSREIDSLVLKDVYFGTNRSTRDRVVNFKADGNGTKNVLKARYRLHKRSSERGKRHTRIAKHTLNVTSDIQTNQHPQTLDPTAELFFGVPTVQVQHAHLSFAVVFIFVMGSLAGAGAALHVALAPQKQVRLESAGHAVDSLVFKRPSAALLYSAQTQKQEAFVV